MSNADVVKHVEAYPDRIIGFASVTPFSDTTKIPRTDPAEELRHAIEEMGLRGLKIHPLIQGFAINDPGLVPLMTVAAELNIPVLFHTGPNLGRAGRTSNAMTEMVEDLALMCPETIIVAGHADPLGVAGYLAASNPNVYLETSISWPRRHEIIPKLAAQTIRTAGAEKVLYGTDFSLGQEHRIREMNTMLDESDLAVDDRALIESGNATRLLGL